MSFLSSLWICHFCCLFLYRKHSDSLIGSVRPPWASLAALSKGQSHSCSDFSGHVERHSTGALGKLHSSHSWLLLSLGYSHRQGCFKSFGTELLLAQSQWVLDDPSSISTKAKRSGLPLVAKMRRYCNSCLKDYSMIPKKENLHI